MTAARLPQPLSQYRLERFFDRSIVAAALAYVSGIGAARRLRARLASFVGLTEVLFAVLIAWFLLDELPTVIQLAGGALILTGVALVRIDDLRIADSDRNYVREAGHAQQVDEIRARIHHPDSTAMPSSGEL